MVSKNIDSLKKMTAGQLLDSLIEKAIESKASYIHIEPRDSKALVRYRINGALVEIDKFSRNRLESLTDKIKSLANLETKLKNIPQDGRFKISIKKETYALRVSILPTIDGEKISINILSVSSEVPSLNELGYWGTGLLFVQNALTQSRGVILLTGPGDSGKSLSLVSMLSNIKNPDIKIATIEDPVEYVIAKANQTQVNHRTNLTFANGLRTIEKQDNDVIMISDLRDSETTNLVFHYSSRNNLILSSLHSKNTNEAIDRLINSGVSRHLVTHSLKIISSQRLVRRLCETCRESFEPDKSTLSLINSIFNLSNPRQIKYIHELEEYYVQATTNKKLVNLRNLNTTETKIKKIYRAHEGGCEDCYHSGYKGLIGLFEIINVSEPIQKLILSLAAPKVLSDRATKEGTVSILVDGLIKSLRGKTSIQEIFRIQQEYL